jgi:hypothetical protein
MGSRVQRLAPGLVLLCLPFLAGADGGCSSSSSGGTGTTPPTEAGATDDASASPDGTGGTPGDATPDAVTSCTTDGDCGSAQICGFPESAGCSATGTCFPAPQVTCDAYEAGCSCSGGIINLACNGLPSGYAPAPLAHPGECGSVDGGL